MSSSRTAESRSGTPENRAGSEVSSAPREEPRKGVKEVGMFEVSWGTEWGVQALGVVIPVFERNGTEETERILEQLKASLVEDNGAAPGDLPRRGTPEAESGHRAQGSGSEKSVEDTGAVQLETAVPSAGETLKRQATTPEPERGSADDGEKRQAARSKPAGSGGMGGTEAELPSGTASTRGLRGPDTIAVHSYSITFRSGEGADPEEADAGGYVLVTEKNLDAILPMSVEVYLPRGEEVETVLGDLGFGGRQYLSKSQVRTSGFTQAVLI